MTVPRQLAKALAQNCQGFAKVLGGDVTFKEGRVSSLPSLIMATERQTKVSEVGAQPNRD